MALLKPYLSIILLAVIVRMLIMPFLFHPDIKTQYYHANFLKDGVFNIYKYIDQNKDNLGYKDTFNYPPLAYYLLGGWSFVTSPLLGQPFESWLYDWGEGRYTNPQIFRQMFILKFPYLILDIGIGLLLVLLLEEKFRKKALLLWFFNPLTLYIIYGLSNFDVIPTFFTLLSLLLFKKERYWLSGISLGLGISTKLFPILFLPLFILPLLFSQKLKETVTFTIGVLSIFLISTLFVFQDFLSVGNSGLITKVLATQITLSGNLAIPIFPILYLIILTTVIIKKGDWRRINYSIIAIIFSIFSITKFHPQWLLWSLPFLVIFLAKKMKVALFFSPLIVGYMLLVLGFDDRYLTLGILSPIVPTIYEVGSFEQTLFSYLNKSTILLAAQLLVAIGAFLTIVTTFNLNNEKD